jgi:hypothetical protein
VVLSAGGSAFAEVAVEEMGSAGGRIQSSSLVRASVCCDEGRG